MSSAAAREPRTKNGTARNPAWRMALLLTTFGERARLPNARGARRSLFRFRELVFEVSADVGERKAHHPARIRARVRSERAHLVFDEAQRARALGRARLLQRACQELPRFGVPAVRERDARAAERVEKAWQLLARFLDAFSHASAFRPSANATPARLNASRKRASPVGRREKTARAVPIASTKFSRARRPPR